MTTDRPLVGVVMGSDSDVEIMKRCAEKLTEFGIPYEMRILSAHRTPDLVRQWASEAAGRGMKVIIAGAGMSAALGGAIAAETTLPVVGVPIDSGPLVGVDAALSTMQMPPGVPVACMSIGKAGATNAAIFAAEIIATSDEKLAERLRNFKAEQARKVTEKDEALRSK
ncbi:MAG: 5-(carboxyamino)imidazole ribonucleotide mutase [Phycisphaerae bacterium]